MIIACFLCEKSFHSIDAYFSHLKSHATPLNIIYKCTISGCYQKFENKQSFKRHLVRHSKQGCSQSPPIAEINEDFDDVHGENEDFNNVHAENEVFDEEHGIEISQNTSNATPSFNYKENLANVFDSAAKFIIKLHSWANLSRSDVITIKTYVEDLILSPVFEFIAKTQNTDDSNRENITNVLSDVGKLFENIKTESRLNRYLHEKNLIGNVKTFKIKETSKSDAILMPIEFQFKKIFERNNFLDVVLEHMQFIESSNKYVNFIQGNLWKQKRSLYPNKIVIPFYLYADDFGINNPLGSKSARNSMCNFYMSLACTPQKSSRLSEIYLVCSLKSSDVRNHGNDCYELLVSSLKKIEIDGIDITTNSGTRRVHFIMGLLLGDNLGLNYILGFSKSFTSNYFCRFCLMNKSETQKETCERANVMRNRINYQESVEQNLFSDTGINSVCAFNEIPSFHCIENYSVDVMHDIFEGVCHHVLTESLLYFIRKMEYISLTEVNARLKVFKYDHHDRGNEKYSITFHELESHKMKMSAKQMISFCQYFTILFGDLVRIQDEVWIFLLKFFEMIDDILCYEISQSFIEILNVKIQNIAVNYQTLFKKKLTPKFHFLLHYSTIMNQCGPLRNIWCFKFEAKHKEFKMYSRIITSRKNVALSFSYKQQLAFAYELIENTLDDHIKLHKIYLDKTVKRKISQKIKTPVDDFMLYLHAEISGYLYTPKKIIAVYLGDFQIFEICLIIKNSSGVILLCCRKVRTEFNVHIAAYECGETLAEYTIIEMKDIVGPPTDYIQSFQEKKIVKLKEFYKNLFTN